MTSSAFHKGGGISDKDSGPKDEALERLAQAVLDGRISATAQSVATGKRRQIHARELDELEFHVASDIPSSPCGFRTRSDQIIRWASLMVVAADVMRHWPRSRLVL
ncbi:MAG: hypothetical protein ABJA60_01530 [Nitrosospira sp.]